MNDHSPWQITRDHLRRKACVYVRRATEQRDHAVGSNNEQEKLRRQAIALGWPERRVAVIGDLGHSGLSAKRPGLKQLFTELESGQVGVVLLSDPSRLTREVRTWRRFLEACALGDALIMHGERLIGAADLLDGALS